MKVVWLSSLTVHRKHGINLFSNVFWRWLPILSSQNIWIQTAYIKIILSRSFYSPSIYSGMSKMRSISQSIFHILIMNQFSLFSNKTRPSAYFCQCTDIESKLTLFFHTKKNKWYCNWGKLVPIKTIVQLWTRACLDRCPYGMLNNGKSNSVMCKSRLIIFNKVLTFIWQIVLFYLAHKLEQICVNYLKCMLGCSLYHHIFHLLSPFHLSFPHPREFCVC